MNLKNENSSYKQFNKTSITKKLSRKISKSKNISLRKNSSYKSLDEDLCAMMSEEKTFLTSTLPSPTTNAPIQKETTKKSSDLVRLAAAKKKHQNKENYVVKASSSSNTQDELRILFRGKHAKTPYSSSMYEIKNTPIDKSVQEQDDNFFDNLYNKKMEHEIKVEDSKDEEKMKKKSSESLTWQEESSPDNENSTNSEANMCNSYDMESCILLLLTLEIALESELPEPFYQRLFQQERIKELIQTSPLFRRGIQNLL